MHMATKIALGSLAWGLAKGFAAGKVGLARGGSHHLFRTCVTGPLEEEILFRSPFGANRWAGPYLGSLLFGLAHWPSGAPPAFTAFKVADATAGGAVYTAAYTAGGLPASVVTHGLHNLGLWLGMLFVGSPSEDDFQPPSEVQIAEVQKVFDDLDAGRAFIDSSGRVVPCIGPPARVPAGTVFRLPSGQTVGVIGGRA